MEAPYTQSSGPLVFRVSYRIAVARCFGIAMAALHWPLRPRANPRRRSPASEPMTRSSGAIGQS
eukprot:4925960-Prorocentrum_lima.AAC.1